MQSFVFLPTDGASTMCQLPQGPFTTSSRITAIAAAVMQINKDFARVASTSTLEGERRSPRSPPPQSPSHNPRDHLLSGSHGEYRDDSILVDRGVFSSLAHFSNTGNF